MEGEELLVLDYRELVRRHGRELFGTVGQIDERHLRAEMKRELTLVPRRMGLCRRQ